MKVGDLVVAKYDVERGIHSIGIITQIKPLTFCERFNIKVHWIGDQLPPLDNCGWWMKEKLKKVE